jgi:hypothetical protein
MSAFRSGPLSKVLATAPQEELIGCIDVVIGKNTVTSEDLSP